MLMADAVQRLTFEVTGRPLAAAFEVAPFAANGYQWSETKGNYPNPTRQRGILGNTGEPLKLNPSLTFRVGMIQITHLHKLLLRVGFNIARIWLQNAR